MISCAIIGVSGYGNTHYEALLRWRQRGVIRIVGATIINQEEELEKCNTLRSFGCQIFRSADQMFDVLSGKIDLCFIPTGINTHAELSIAAMRAGADVLVEKPVAATIQVVREMQRAEREFGRRVFVGFQLYSQPEVRKICELIHDPSFGMVCSVRCIGLAPRSLSYYRRNDWAGKFGSPGRWILDCPFNNALAHYLHLSLIFADAVEDGIADFEAQLFRVNPMIECADSGAILMKTGRGVQIGMYASHAAEESVPLKIVIESVCGNLIEWSFNSTRCLIDGQTIQYDNLQGG